MKGQKVILCSTVQGIGGSSQVRGLYTGNRYRAIPDVTHTLLVLVWMRPAVFLCPFL